MIGLLAAFRARAIPGPSANLAGIDIEKVKNARKRVVDHFLDRIGQGVKCRDGRIDDGTRFSHGGHIADMPDMQRRFAEHKHKAPPFLLRNVSGT